MTVPDLPSRQYCTIALIFELPEKLAYIPYLRQKVRVMLTSLEVSQGDIEEIETIIGELATNAVRHAQGGPYRVHIELSDHLAMVSVIDQGKGFPPDALPPPGTTRPEDLIEDIPERIGGFGLPLVRSMADQVDISPNKPPSCGMTVRAQKKLQQI